MVINHVESLEYDICRDLNPSLQETKDVSCRPIHWAIIKYVVAFVIVFHDALSEHPYKLAALMKYPSRFRSFIVVTARPQFMKESRNPHKTQQYADLRQTVFWHKKEVNVSRLSSIDSRQIWISINNVTQI